MFVDEMPFKREFHGLLFPLMEPIPWILPGWGAPPNLVAKFAFATMSNHNGLRMGQLRYASHELLDLIGTFFTAVSEWRETGKTDPILFFLEELFDATRDPTNLRVVVTRDYILPEIQRRQVWIALEIIKDELIREGVREAIRANHDYLPLATVLEKASAQSLNVLGRLYRAIAVFQIDKQSINKWQHNTGEIP